MKKATACPRKRRERERGRARGVRSEREERGIRVYINRRKKGKWQQEEKERQ